MTEDQLGEERLDKIFRDLTPSREVRWRECGPTEARMVFTGRVSVKVTQEAIEQAASEPGALPRLRMEVERAMRESESGTAIGVVTAV